MIGFRKIATLLYGLSHQRPAYMFMKGLEKYKPSESQKDILEVLNGFEEKLNKKELSEQQIKEMINQNFFKYWMQNNNFQDSNQEEDIELSKDITDNQKERLEKLKDQILPLLQSEKLDKLDKFQLMEQTILIDDIHHYFIKNVLKSEYEPKKKIASYLLEVICRQHKILYTASKQAPYFDISKYSSIVQNFQRKEVIQNLSLLDIALLLEVDLHFFRKQIQSQLINQAVNLIIQIKEYNEQAHLRALEKIFKFVRSRRINFSPDGKVIMHLIQILPIDVLNTVMKLVKITNFEYSDVQKIYSSIQQKHLATYKLENIPLISTMNVYVPAQSAANFYLSHLQSDFDQGNYLELLEMIPDFIRIFYPKYEAINYISDRLQVKLSTSNYQTIDSECSNDQKIKFIQLLSKFLVSLLHADLIKNDFFLIKTLLFVNKNASLIKQKQTIKNFSYFFNQIYESQTAETPLNPNIEEQIELFNQTFPPQESTPIPSNTETKIFKFLLQTNHFALQNVRIGSFNVDILVHPDIIVEYNGYDHYRYDLKQKGYNLEQFTLEHLYREKQLLKLKNYKIANINFKQWSTLYELEKQYTFLRNLVLKQE